MSELKKSSHGRLPDGAPNPIDVHVGNRKVAKHLFDLIVSMSKSTAGE